MTDRLTEALEGLPRHKHRNVEFVPLIGVRDALAAARSSADGLAEALAVIRMFGHEYDVDGRQEWHSLNCIYRKTWSMGGEDEPQCVAARAALRSETHAGTPTTRLVPHDHRALACEYPCDVLAGTMEPER